MSTAAAPFVTTIPPPDQTLEDKPMTYPQPPGGQHPYGPPGGGHDPSAQFPTHQYGGVPGGGYGAPPPKNKTGVVVAIVAIVVLVLGGLGITGFVAPGFFLSAQDGDTEPTIEPSAPETAESTDVSVEVPTVPTDAPPDDGTPTAGGQPVEPAALNAMQSFLDSVNAGDAAAAKSQLCAEAINTTAEVDELVGYQPALEIDPTMEGISTGDRSVQLYLRGTAKGQELEGYSTNLWVTSYDGPWCVHAFRVVVV